MSKTILYIATSEDGFIADKNGPEALVQKRTIENVIYG